jgi:hypothetical protein
VSESIWDDDSDLEPDEDGSDTEEEVLYCHCGNELYEGSGYQECYDCYKARTEVNE